MIDAAIEELIPVVDVRKACEVAGESQAGWYRRHRPSPRRRRLLAPQSRGLPVEE